MLLSLSLLITGFNLSTNTGMMSFNGTILSIPNSQFISFVTKSGNDYYAIDENYGGSRLFRLQKNSSSLYITDTISEPACRGAVFIEKTDDRFFIPCFGSDNLWVVNDLFRTETIMGTGHRPHGAYMYRDTLYVPCRGDRGYRSDEIRIYDTRLRELSPIRLGSDAGPRHMIFVNDSFYVVTEFSHRVFRFSVVDHRYLGQTDLVPDHPDNTIITGSEIRFLESKNRIVVALRYEGRPGRLLFLDTDLNEICRTEVGRNPRFFDLYGDSVIVLNQDDKNLMWIGSDTETSADLGMNPQSFCVL
jgi:6-phosphogluconolactonase (cycloisomerase 2 family)